MRIAFVGKRQYMNKDVIEDRYARMYELPRQLAAKGHDVLGLCLSYRTCEERNEIHESSMGTLVWRGLCPRQIVIPGILGYPFRAARILREFGPDIIVGESDAPHIVLAAWLAKQLGSHYAVDLYDNFESFGLSHLPGLKWLYRHAIRQADVVSCVSKALADLVKETYTARGEVLALPSTIDHAQFFPRDKRACRLRFNLPINGKLIGTAGGLSREKGIEPLYKAFERLVSGDTSIHLVLAGTLDARCQPPSHPNVHYMGTLSHEATADMFGALDVGVVYLRNTPYGRFSFPQKAYEMAACRLPLAVARVGAMESLFQNYPSNLYEPDDANSLARCVADLLAQPEIPDLPIVDWAELADQLELAYSSALRRVCSVC